MLKAIRRNIYKVTGQVLNTLPEFVANYIVRGMFKPNYTLPADWIFKIAETEDEFEQAFKLVHDSYVDINILKSTEHGLRASKYNALPTTTVLIVKSGDEVIATMSLIVDSQLKLPIDSLWDIQDIRSDFFKICEVSSLAIKRSHRKKRGELLIPLCRFMYDICYEYLNLDALVITIHPNAKAFYKALFNFEEINHEVKEYESLEGAKAIGLKLNLQKTRDRFTYLLHKNKNKKQNIYSYFVEHSFKEFKYPDKKFNIFHSKPLSPNILNYFFNEKTDVFESLNSDDLCFLKRFYYFKDYKNIIGSKDLIALDTRREPRFIAHLNSVLVDMEKNQFIPFKIFDVSLTGVSGYTKHCLEVNQQIILKIKMSNERQQDLIIHAVCKSKHIGQNKYGFAISYTSTNQWKELIEYLNSQFHPEADTEDSGDVVLTLLSKAN